MCSYEKLLAKIIVSSFFIVRKINEQCHNFNIDTRCIGVVKSIHREVTIIGVINKILKLIGDI